MLKQNISKETWGSEKGGKYRLRDNDGNEVDKTPEDTCDRVAKELSKLEENNTFWYDEYKRILGYNFAGGGRIMANIGSGKYKKETSAINCVVSRQIPDSMFGIMSVALESSLILRAGCGVGYDFSTIRPKGAYVFGAGAATSGILSFMKIFDVICSTVMSGGGRRGAQLAGLDIQHPEIEDFIVAKRVEGAFRYFNFSVLITDEFMNAVKNNKDWDLWFWQKTNESISPDKIKLIKKDDIPYNYSNYNYFSFDSDHVEIVFSKRLISDVFKKKVFKTVKAKDLYEMITKSTYTYNDPGFILIDRVNKENNLWFTETIRTTNPCTPAWATVLTPLGISTIGNINIGDTIWSGYKWTKVINKVCSGIKPVYAYTTRAGTFYGTENHKVVSNGKKVEVKDASTIDTSVGDIFDLTIPENYKTYIMDGLLIGDGVLYNSRFYLNIGKNDEDYYSSKIKNMILKDKTKKPIIKREKHLVKHSLLKEDLPKTFDRKVPDKYKFADNNTKRFFLKGLYSASGFLIDDRITLRTFSKQIIEDVQQMLSSMGILSYYTAYNIFKKETHEYKKSYDLNIGVLASRKIFYKTIGFLQNYKNKELALSCLTNPNHPYKKSFEIVERVFINEEDVYDITVDAEEHTYWSGGLLISNCGEQPLAPLSNCLLGSMILCSYIKDPFESHVSFDWDNFKKDIHTASRLLDNVVELNNLPLKELSDNLIDKRRHGLGFTGLGSALNMLRLKYNSKEGIEFAEKISKILAQESLLASIELSKEKGPAPFSKSPENRKLFLQSKYIKRLLDTFENKKDIISEILSHGVRWSHATSIAPTGTLSITWGNNCSTGLEPVFANFYLRNIRIPGKKTKTQEEVYDYSYFEWKRLNGDKQLPDWWTTTDDLLVEDHINMQSVIQLYTDSATSKTLNIPTTYAYEDFKKVYFIGWEKGLKGLTTYRYNPEVQGSVLLRKEDIDNANYSFVLEDGNKITVKGSEEIEYDGETHIAANLFDALKEGIYGNM